MPRPLLPAPRREMFPTTIHTRIEVFPNASLRENKRYTELATCHCYQTQPGHTTGEYNHQSTTSSATLAVFVQGLAGLLSESDINATYAECRTKMDRDSHSDVEWSGRHLFPKRGTACSSGDSKREGWGVDEERDKAETDLGCAFGGCEGA